MTQDVVKDSVMVAMNNKYANPMDEEWIHALALDDEDQIRRMIG